MKWFYLSFCDEDRPAGEKFLGACIVRGTDIARAAEEAWTRGCNPGGQVLGVDIEFGPSGKPPDALCNRLMQLEELKQHFGNLVHPDGTNA